MMTDYFDSHAHYDDPRFEQEFEGGTDGALLAAKANGVGTIVNVGANVQSSRASVRLAEKYVFVYAAVGIHPSDAQQVEAGRETKVLDEIFRLLYHEKAVALGEIGLDYHYDDTDKERQKLFFDAQLSLAESAKRPVIIHDRDAHGDVFDLLTCHPNAFGVLHSYSGSAEMAKQLLSKGWYLSFSGPVTYKNAEKVREAARVVPKDRLLIETDAPYLPPVPYRGKINYSGYLPYTAKALADARGESVEEVAGETAENARRLFSIAP